MKRVMRNVQRLAVRLAMSGLLLIAGKWLAGLWWRSATADDVLSTAELAGFALVILGVVALFLPGTEHTGPDRAVHPPVAGRWLALNSPATRVPSHGTRAYGQSHAVDLVYEPLDRERPAFGAGPGMRPPQDFPAFGEPVLSPVPGRVVRVRDRARDHRSRNARWSLVYLLLEGMLREFGGAGRVIGNHVVVDAGDGCFALVAHLRQGSATVREGDTVRAGQQLARCGNSGNSTEPHVHVQLMDRASPGIAQGLPMRFAGVRIGDGPVTDGMPADNEHLTPGQAS
ncbi:M23 family metallopeptidase [Qaidamihabitans albus]|uniref:M23 family metallopeptidase n=1 Tax=Qaidamihabitans albus TaxID=2795733 RepID=UPI0018F1DA81|nr:M23 family metallopeptidase [Qaidamihabitans albus]